MLRQVAEGNRDDDISMLQAPMPHCCRSVGSLRCGVGRSRAAASTRWPWADRSDHCVLQAPSRTRAALTPQPHRFAHQLAQHYDCRNVSTENRLDVTMGQCGLGSGLGCLAHRVGKHMWRISVDRRARFSLSVLAGAPRSAAFEQTEELPNQLMRLVLLFCAVQLVGCALTPEQQREIVNSFAAGAQGGLEASAAPPKFMVFGGPGHNTYLGCLNCNEYSPESVLNQYGTFGSVYSATSVANPYSQFGSPYSMYSACNPLASDPPVIVDGSGNFYGRLTVNQLNPERTRDSTVLAWLAGMCQHQ